MLALAIGLIAGIVGILANFGVVQQLSFVAPYSFYLLMAGFILMAFAYFNRDQV